MSILSKVNKKIFSSYFKLLNTKKNYIISKKKINMLFKNKIKIWHPDKFIKLSTKNLNKIEKIASEINFAKNALNNDLKRAVHLLDLEDSLKKDQTFIKDELLIEELVSIRLNIQESTIDLDQLRKIQKINEENIRISLQFLSWLIECEEIKNAKKCVNKITYYFKVIEALKVFLPII